MDIELTKKIKEYARECGFVACGITRAEDFEGYGRALDNLIIQFPETEPLYRHMYRRAKVKDLNPWAKSVIVCIRDYGKYKVPQELKGYIARNYLFDCRVPKSPEYQMAGEFISWLRAQGIKVRKGGVPDRLVAGKAGVSSIGKNTFAYADGYGSWVNIITYLVDVELVPDNPISSSPCPSGCSRCIDACPTGALVNPYVMRMDRCIAYLTYQAPLPLDRELEEKMGKWIYGCDICQEVCPLNKSIRQEYEPLPYLEEIAHLLTPQELSIMDSKRYAEVVYPLFYYIPPDEIDRWHRNAKRSLRLTSL